VLTVNTLPAVAIDPFPSATVCIANPAISLPAATPSGGVYSGTGVSGTNFDPATAGEGTHTVTYTYADANGCSASASTTIAVDLCTGIGSLEAGDLMVFPNPASDQVTLSGRLTGLELQLTDVTGKTIFSDRFTADTYNLDLQKQEIAAGIYLLKINESEKTLTVRKLIIK
jgi:hypothetical protein